MKLQVLKEKYRENKESATILKEKELYNASTSRYYYSIFQKIIVYNLNKGGKIFTGKDAHKKTIEYFLKSYCEVEGIINKLEEKYIKDKIKNIKKYRITADYNNYEKINFESIEKVEILYNSLDGIINL